MKELALMWLPGCATCLATKTFLAEHNLPYLSLNVHEDADARQAWHDIGQPALPILMVDGQSFGVMNPIQLSSLLGIDLPDQPPASRLAWDILTVQNAWCQQLRMLSWEVLISPTPSRDRTVCNLVVNVFRTFVLVTESWNTGKFAWGFGDDVLAEAQAARELEDSGRAESVVWYAEQVSHAWERFAFDNFSNDDVSEQSRYVVHPTKGTVAFATLLMGQRWHAALHLEQVRHHAATKGETRVESVFDSFHDLELPAEIF